MTLDDETASRIADETWAKRGKRHTVSGEEYVRAGWDARDAEVEELRAEWERRGETIRTYMAENEAWSVKAHTAQRRAERAEAALAKVRDFASEQAEEIRVHYGRTAPAGYLGFAHACEDVLAILDESPTERETPADEWEYGLADDGATEPYSDISTDRDWILDGVHPLDEGTKLLRRRKAGPWEVCE